MCQAAGQLADHLHRLSLPELGILGLAIRNILAYPLQDRLLCSRRPLYAGLDQPSSPAG